MLDLADDEQAIMEKFVLKKEIQSLNDDSSC